MAKLVSCLCSLSCSVPSINVQVQPTSLCMFVIKPSSQAVSKRGKVKGFKTLKMLILSSYNFLSAIVSLISVLWVCGHAAFPGSSQQSDDTAHPKLYSAQPCGRASPVTGGKVEAFHYPRIWCGCTILCFWFFCKWPSLPCHNHQIKVLWCPAAAGSCGCISSPLGKNCNGNDGGPLFPFKIKRKATHT